MGTRIKNFEATGIAPNGRLYAGDLNSIQDDYADLSNFTQTVDVGTLRVGESGLQLLRYGTGEFRMTGHLRADGIFRGLGGLYAGAFTTAQRDAIPVGSRPYGLIILNTTANRLEVNVGTDATPDWRGIAYGTSGGEIPAGTGGFMPPGAFVPYGGSSAPPGYLLCDGTSYPVGTPGSAYYALWQAIGYSWGGSGANFNVPNMKGMIPVMRDAAVTEFAGAVGTGGGAKDQALTNLNQLPPHDHGGGIHAHVVNEAAHGHNVTEWDHHHGFGTPNILADGGNPRGVLNGWFGGAATELYVYGWPYGTGAADKATAIVANKTNLTVQNSGAVITSQGSSATHPNLQPFKLCNYIIKT